MVPLHQITRKLAAFAPLELAESWDNVGLLLGDESAMVSGILTCLTLTPDVAEEAVRLQTQLIVSHHPLLFRPVQKLTAATSEGRTIQTLLQQGIAVYSPHTAFDNAAQGINQQLAEQLELREIHPLRPSPLPHLNGLGTGRWGKLETPCSLREFLDRVQRVGIAGNPETNDAASSFVLYTGDLNQSVSTVGLCCGSGGELMQQARRCGCDLFLTGETRFHSCLEAQALEIALIQAGHYSTERPAIEFLARFLQSEFPELRTQASQIERDPLKLKAF